MQATGTAEVTVTNTGKRAGDEVAQLYLTSRRCRVRRCARCAASSACIWIAGASQKVRFELKPRDLSMVTEAGEPVIAEGAYTVSVGGGQPEHRAQVLTATFHVKGRRSCRSNDEY